MIYQAFFFLCVIAVVSASLMSDRREKALFFGCIGLGVAYLFELNGVLNHEWSYANVHSVLRVTDIPIEILFGYFTATFFIIIIIAYLPRLSSEERRIVLLQYALLVTGIVLLIAAYAYHSVPLVVGWVFMGIFGLSVSRDMSIPLTVGLCAFLADWAVEGMLTNRMEYYSNGWDPTIALIFMFAGMFISGVFTHPLMTFEIVSLQERAVVLEETVEKVIGSE